MKVLLTRAYRQNRARFSAKDLKPYDGQWVAFSSDGSRIVASGESVGQLSERLVELGEDIQEHVLEKVEINSGDVRLGGAELL